MSGGMMNLGMGFGFTPQRQDSQVVASREAANDPAEMKRWQDLADAYRASYASNLSPGTDFGAAASDTIQNPNWHADFQGTIANAQAQANAYQSMNQNAAVQQQAYNQQNGGGFAGGLLNESYSNPFGNTITGLMGGAGTTAAPSTGLTPFGAPAAPQGQQTANAGGWGGPFSNKNPWSLG